MNGNQTRLALISLVAAVALAACATVSPAQPVAEPDAPPAADQPADPVQAVESAVEETPEPAADDESAPEPADSQPEPAAPADSDPFPAPITAQGEILIVSGRVLDVNGTPLTGAAVEFWQTDASGVYDHPGDSATTSRDLGFQFYGTSVTDAEGQYRFRTILPGEYEPRPRHIHVKVKQDGVTLLTTQFYFAEDGSTGGFGGGIDNLLLTLNADTASNGRAVYTSTFDVVVDTGIGSGYLDWTDSQGEGPYYPVVDVSAYDNDLASVEN